MKHYDEHMKYSLDIRHKLQQINDELQQNPQMKVENIDAIKAQLERYADDLRTIQADSTALDHLMEESNATITDSSTNRNIFFVVECRAIQNLVDAIENKVRSTNHSDGNE